MALPAREAAKKKQQKKPASITEVIAAAADVVISRPLLMIAPLLLDLYYLAGWKIIPGSTFDRLRTRVADLGSSGSERLADTLGSASTTDMTGMLAFVIPSFLAGSPSEAIYRPTDRAVLAADNWGALMLSIVVLLGLTMFFFGVFGLWLADAGLQRERSWGERIRLGPVVGGRFVLLILLVLAMVLLLCLPLLIAMVVGSMAGVGMEGLAVSFMVLVGLGLYVLFYFAPDSLLVDLAGPVQALRASSAVVRGNLWITLGFAIVSLIISIGLADVWDRVATNAPGLAIALLANAFVGCVLWIASLLLFNERSKLLEINRVASTTTRTIA